MVPDPLDFFKKYELIASSKGYTPTPVKANVCKFCGNSIPNTTFLQDTHLLPELMGENNILTYEECDQCNKSFSDYESSLSIFIRPYITLTGIKSKKKIPGFQSRTENRNEDTRTSLVHKDQNRKELILTQKQDYILDEENKSFDIIFRKPPFTPLKIYKALLRIALSLLPKQYEEDCKKSFDWITNKTNSIGFFKYGFLTTLKKAYFKTPFCELYKVKSTVSGNEEFIEYTLVVAAANFVMQIFLPFSDSFDAAHDDKRNLCVELFPLIIFDKLVEGAVYQINYVELGIDYAITHDHRITFSYDSLEKA